MELWGLILKSEDVKHNPLDIVMNGAEEYLQPYIWEMNFTTNGSKDYLQP